MIVAAPSTSRSSVYPQKISVGRDLGVPNLRGCSLDGDADRLVYWFHGLSNFEIVDGDKIASLLAVFVASELVNAQPSSAHLH